MSLVHSTAPCRRPAAASRRPRTRPPRRVLAALCVSLIASAALTACSSDDPESSGRGGKIPTGASAAHVHVRTSVTRVHGELSDRGREALVRHAERLITGYVAAAYFHQRPGSAYRGSFPGFTRGARKLALKDTATTSDRTYVDADEIRPRGAVAFLSVVAPHGRPVGVTARLELKLAVVQGDRTRWRKVSGRLLLSPGAHRWRVFGYDLAMAPTAPQRRGRGRGR